jgi:class 3 adenylate cyclase
MPYQSLEEEIDILRGKAEKLRELGMAHQTALSPQLLEMAADLEARADTLVRRLRGFKGDLSAAVDGKPSRSPVIG